MAIDWAAEYHRITRGKRFGEPHLQRSKDDVAHPPLSPAEVHEAEEQLGITFPAEYRDHLIRVSAGGRRIRRLYRGRTGWGWEGDHDTNYGLLTTPFPHPDSYRRYEDELDDREPQESDYPDDGAYRTAWASWDDEYGVLQERKTAGAVYIQEGGCGFNTLLVVTGPHRGTMWYDERATSDLIRPLRLAGQPMSFADWLPRQ